MSWEAHWPCPPAGHGPRAGGSEPAFSLVCRDLLPHANGNKYRGTSASSHLEGKPVVLRSFWLSYADFTPHRAATEGAGTPRGLNHAAVRTQAAGREEARVGLD